MLTNQSEKNEMTPKKSASAKTEKAKHKKPKTVARKRLTQAERSNISEKRIFDAAVKLICEHGSHNTTLKDIGEQAGYSRALPSHRFGSKEDFLRHLITNFNNHWAHVLRESVKDLDGIAAIEKSLATVQKFLLSEPHYMRAMYILWYESIASFEQIRAQLSIQHERYRQDVVKWASRGMAEGTIRSDISPRAISVQFCSFIFGTIYQWLVNPSAIDIRDSFETFQVNLLVMIRA